MLRRQSIVARCRIPAMLVVTACAHALTALPAAAGSRYEVWAIDQSNSPGRAFGGTLYIWAGHDLENRHKAPSAPAETVDLGGEAAALCLSRTGANPVRPHMIAMNASQTHAIISFVASGHVLFLDADSRAPVECLRTAVGSTGARQVHFAIPAPDETYISVANQNGKLFERYTFVTLRGGGLFVVDSQATPMQIVAEYDNATVHGSGCLGAEVPGKVYIDSGGGTAANLFQADLATRREPMSLTRNGQHPRWRAALSRIGMWERRSASRGWRVFRSAGVNPFRSWRIRCA